MRASKGFNVNATSLEGLNDVVCRYGSSLLKYLTIRTGLDSLESQDVLVKIFAAVKAYGSKSPPDVEVWIFALANYLTDPAASPGMYTNFDRCMLFLNDLLGSPRAFEALGIADMMGAGILTEAKSHREAFRLQKHLSGSCTEVSSIGVFKDFKKHVASCPTCIKSSKLTKPYLVADSLVSSPDYNAVSKAAFESVAPVVAFKRNGMPKVRVGLPLSYRTAAAIAVLSVLLVVFFVVMFFKPFSTASKSSQPPLPAASDVESSTPSPSYSATENPKYSPRPHSTLSPTPSSTPTPTASSSSASATSSSTSSALPTQTPSATYSPPSSTPTASKPTKTPEPDPTKTPKPKPTKTPKPEPSPVKPKLVYLWQNLDAGTCPETYSVLVDVTDENASGVDLYGYWVGNGVTSNKVKLSKDHSSYTHTFKDIPASMDILLFIENDVTKKFKANITHVCPQ